MYALELFNAWLKNSDMSKEKAQNLYADLVESVFRKDGIELQQSFDVRNELYEACLIKQADKGLSMEQVDERTV